MFQTVLSSMAGLGLKGENCPLLCLHRLSFKQDWSLPWQATSHVWAVSSFALSLLGRSAGGQFLPLQGAALGEGVWVTRAAWHRSCWSATTSKLQRWASGFCASLTWIPCRRSGGMDTLQLGTGTCALPMGIKWCVFHTSCSIPVLWECNHWREHSLPRFHFDTSLVESPCRAPCELSHPESFAHDSSKARFPSDFEIAFSFAFPSS